MKKIMIMGLMLAVSACSAAPSREELVRDILSETLKGSYVSYGGTLAILQQSGEDFETIVTVDNITATIDSLDFVVPVADPKDTEIKFEYIETLDDTWLVYKVTYGTTVRYTALATGIQSGKKVIVIESTTDNSPEVEFRVNKADIDPQKNLFGWEGSLFLLAPTTRSTQDQSIIEITIPKASN